MIKQKILLLWALSVAAVVNYVEAFAPILHGRQQQQSCRHATVTQTHHHYRPCSTPSIRLPHQHGLFQELLSTTSRNPRQNSRHSTALHSAAGGGGFGFIQEIAASVFRWDIGQVPLGSALGINVLLFATLSSKLFTMLTPSGFYNALFLGTMLWTTLGWRGWVYCVLYLFFGQAVTKVRFQEKEVSLFRNIIIKLFGKRKEVIRCLNRSALIYHIHRAKGWLKEEVDAEALRTFGKPLVCWNLLPYPSLSFFKSLTYVPQCMI